MPKPSLLPDPMPLRDALRALRFVLQRSGETLAAVLPVDTLPQPAARVAGAMLREAGHLAQGFDDTASGLARLALNGTAPALTDLSADESDRFAASLYAALRFVLTRLHAMPAHVSEMAIRQVCDSLPPAPTPPDHAAALSLALRRGKILRGATIHNTTPLPETQLDALAIFAVLLCLLTDRQDGEEEALLASATDLALALSSEVLAAFATEDPARLAALYAKYARHV